MDALKTKVWHMFNPGSDGSTGMDWVDKSLLALIFLNVVAVIAGSVDAVEHRFGGLLHAFELISVVIFAVEYVARLWSCSAAPQYGGGWRGRLRFALTPMAIIDLLAIAPAVVPLFAAVDLRVLRMLRLLRVLRIAKLVRYVESLALFRRVLASKREELIVTSVIWLFLVVMSSTVMYFAEHEAQPNVFPDIPTTMWWAVMTLTTIGYGDVVPQTGAGRLITALVAILGIGLFALPTAILGSAFVEAVQARKQPRTCPHCGKPLA
jgi:voltage-gated potassium channel